MRVIDGRVRSPRRRSAISEQVSAHDSSGRLARLRAALQVSPLVEEPDTMNGDATALAIIPWGRGGVRAGPVQYFPPTVTDASPSQSPTSAARPSSKTDDLDTEMGEDPASPLETETITVTRDFAYPVYATSARTAGQRSGAAQPGDNDSRSSGLPPQTSATSSSTSIAANGGEDDGDDGGLSELYAANMRF